MSVPTSGRVGGKGVSMAKQAIIIVSREQVEADIKREMDKGKSREEAAYHVWGHAESAIQEAKKITDELLQQAGGRDKFTEQQEAEYDHQCWAIIEPETQRIGHCKTIIAELTPKKK